jgi:hypothetical protein
MSTNWEKNKGMVRSCISSLEICDHIPEYPQWITLSALVYHFGQKIPPESAVREYLLCVRNVAEKRKVDEAIAVQRGRRWIVGRMVSRRMREKLKYFRLFKRNCNGDIEYSKKRTLHLSKETTNGNGNSNVPSTKRHRQAAGNRTRRIHQVVKHQPRARPAGG